MTLLTFSNVLAKFHQLLGKEQENEVNFTMLYQRMVARKEISTVAKTKNSKARKNSNNCIGNK